MGRDAEDLDIPRLQLVEKLGDYLDRGEIRACLGLGVEVDSGDGASV